MALPGKRQKLHLPEIRLQTLQIKQSMVAKLLKLKSDIVSLEVDKGSKIYKHQEGVVGH